MTSYVAVPDVLSKRLPMLPRGPAAGRPCNDKKTSSFARHSQRRRTPRSDLCLCRVRCVQQNCRDRLSPRGPATPKLLDGRSVKSDGTCSGTRIHKRTASQLCHRRQRCPPQKPNPSPPSQTSYADYDIALRSGSCVRSCAFAFLENSPWRERASLQHPWTQTNSRALPARPCLDWRCSTT
jgi:hypothetical protein